MAYNLVFMDIDNTLLDFHAATRSALAALLGEFGQSLTPALEEQFHRINDRLWAQYERGEIPKAEIFPRRFTEFLAPLGISLDPLAANGRYARGLRQSAVFMPHAKELLEHLRGQVRMFAVTNGVATTQTPRLEKAGLPDYFEQIFISEAMGCKKPEKAFFDQVFAAIGPVDKSQCIILGDSLTSDMQGGRNAGIATCYYGTDPDTRCDYAIEDLMDFVKIVLS